VPDIFGQFQSLVAFALYIGALGLAGYALIDAIRVPTNAFPAAGKLTKNIWLIILGVATAVLLVLNPLNIIGLAAVIAAAVYLVDVRPAVKQAGGGRGANDGPYGPW
jgi:Protein of unknown function (DUF2516)